MPPNMHNAKQRSDKTKQRDESDGAIVTVSLSQKRENKTKQTAVCAYCMTEQSRNPEDGSSNAADMYTPRLL